MAHIGFKKLKEMFAKKGLKNPAGAAAAVGMHKYGKSKMQKAAHSGHTLKESQKLKK
jgi:hypothetical protein